MPENGLAGKTLTTLSAAAGDCGDNAGSRYPADSVVAAIGNVQVGGCVQRYAAREGELSVRRRTAVATVGRRWPACVADPRVRGNNAGGRHSADSTVAPLGDIPDAATTTPEGPESRAFVARPPSPMEGFPPALGPPVPATVVMVPEGETFRTRLPTESPT
jgi:hypothetical protein